MIFVFVELIVASASATGCGLDWTLPQAHFNGVEEHGYVAYWEKMAEVDLGDGLVIPVNIGFNSHRESSSPTLGKGWSVALLESHVEPLDENSMAVVMPDGWTFFFYRNGNTGTWRGNAGWAGETNGAIFTIAAPCGWRIKYDGGKIQEIESNKSRTMTYRYNGLVATEVDVDGKPFVQVEATSSGVVEDILIDGVKISVSLAQRPRIQTALKQNLVTGFDLSLGQLLWPDGKKETFAFGTGKNFDPTLAITSTVDSERDFTWDATTRQIKADGNWIYNLQQVAGHIRFNRSLAPGQMESFESDDAKGLTIVKSLTGNDIATYRFVGGQLAGLVRKIEEWTKSSRTTLYSASYYPSGNLMREMFYPDRVRLYSDSRKLLKETIAGQVDYEQDFDDQGRLVHMLNPSQGIEVKSTYDAQGGQVTRVFKQGALFYTENIDSNNNLISFNQGTP